MKLYGKSALILLVILTAFLLANCNKEVTEEERKEKILQKILSDIVADSVEKDVLWLQNMGTRYTYAENKRDVVEKIKKRFIILGYDDVKIDSFYLNIPTSTGYSGGWHYNIIATLEGSLYPDSLCVIGGHYDDYLNSGYPFTIVPGANDNASGVSAVLEISRVLKKNDFKPESTIKFIAFGSEELGLFGSNNFASDPQGFTNKIRFMLNFDMIAYEPSDDPASWIVNIIDYDNSHFLRKEAEAMCTKYTQLQFINDNTDSNRSDSYPFFTHGYKALFYFSYTFDPDYHSLNDLAANCNFNYCKEIVKASCALLVNKN